jgi:hypothetical protein
MDCRNEQARQEGIPPYVICTNRYSIFLPMGCVLRPPIHYVLQQD